MESIFLYSRPETAAESGQLRGLKIAIQPNISAAGWPTDAGSNALHNYTALEDSTIIQRLRQAGASICGSLRMSEFGLGLHNSQAGEAVGKGAADAELMIDLVGESRQAAARTGVCGFKPSYGLVSRYGLVGLIPSMECCGILARKTEHIREILKTVAGPDERDFSLPDEKTPDFSPRKIVPRETTIGVIKESHSALPAEQAKGFLSEIEILQNAGFTLKDMSMTDFSLFSLIHRIVGSVEASSCAGRYDSVRYGKRAPGVKNWNEMYLTSREAAFGPLLKSYLFQGAFFQFERYRAYEDACRIRARLVKEMQGLTEQADYLVFPAASYAQSDEPPLLADLYTQFATTVFASVTGQPVFYLPPPGTTRAGLQLAGPRLSDTSLLALGECLLNLRRGGN